MYFSIPFVFLSLILWFTVTHAPLSYYYISSFFLEFFFIRWHNFFIAKVWYVKLGKVPRNMCGGNNKNFFHSYIWRGFSLLALFKNYLWIFKFFFLDLVLVDNIVNNFIFCVVFYWKTHFRHICTKKIGKFNIYIYK